MMFVFPTIKKKFVLYCVVFTLPKFMYFSSPESTCWTSYLCFIFVSRHFNSPTVTVGSVAEWLVLWTIKLATWVPFWVATGHLTSYTVLGVTLHGTVTSCIGLD